MRSNLAKSMKNWPKNNMASVLVKAEKQQQIKISTKRSAVGLSQVFQTGCIKLNTSRVPPSGIFLKEVCLFMHRNGIIGAACSRPIACLPMCNTMPSEYWFLLLFLFFLLLCLILALNAVQHNTQRSLAGL